jgi:hypothetical protein
VVFAMNHDTERNARDGRHGIGGMVPAHQLELQVDLMHAVLFALGNGAPLILNSLSDTGTVEEGLAFRAKLSDCRTLATFVDLEPRLLWIERGDRGVAVVNAGEKPVWVASLPATSLLQGLYVRVKPAGEADLAPRSFGVRTAAEKKQVLWENKSPRVRFPPRTACFYVSQPSAQE